MTNADPKNVMAMVKTMTKTKDMFVDEKTNALVVRGWEAAKAQLDAASIGYTLSRSGRRALFCRDPDGNALELVESA